MAKRYYHAKTNNATYSYGKVGGEPNSQLRGGGLSHPDVKQYLISKGFRWTFRRGPRSVRAYEAPMSPHQLIEVLLHLKGRGLDVKPSTGLHPKRWLYLDMPKVFNTKAIKTGETIPFEVLSEWLADNGYSRLNNIEQPGDYSVVGDRFDIWTRKNDMLVRVMFDGEMVESISQVDPESLDATYVPNIVIDGLIDHTLEESASVPTPVEVAEAEQTKEKEISVEEAMTLYADVAAAWATKVFAESIEPPKPNPAIVKKVFHTSRSRRTPVRVVKYTQAKVEEMRRNFIKLDEKHPFFNMIKWNS